MKYWFTIFTASILIIFLPGFLLANGGDQHEPSAHKEMPERHHEGISLPSLLTGGATLSGLLFTFGVGFLGRRKVTKFKVKHHSLGAYITISLAFIHVIVNLLTH